MNLTIKTFSYLYLIIHEQLNKSFSTISLRVFDHMSQACTSCIQNENVAESPVFEKMPYPNFDRVFFTVVSTKDLF